MTRLDKIMITENAKKLSAETGSAQNALWSALATAAGFFVSAASVLTALHPNKDRAVFMIVVIVGAFAIWSVLLCFLGQKDHFMLLLTGELRKEAITSANHRKAFARARGVQLLERIAVILVGLDTVAFVYLCEKILDIP